MAALYCGRSEWVDVLNLVDHHIMSSEFILLGQWISAVRERGQMKRFELVCMLQVFMLAWLKSTEINHTLSALPKTSEQGTGSNEANHYFRWLVAALMRPGIASEHVMTGLHPGKVDTMPI